MCLLALLACLGLLGDLIPKIWLHPNLRSNLSEPAYLYICCAILLCTYFKHSSPAAYLTGALGLALIDLPLPYPERLWDLAYYSFSFAFISLWCFLKVPMKLLFILLCFDMAVAFQFKVFLNKVTPPLTPLSWHFETHPEHVLYLLILPCLAFGFRKLKPALHERA